MSVATAKPLPDVQGTIKVKFGDGEVYTKPPRKGPHFRVKHPQYGHRLVPATTAEEAVAKYAEERCPGLAGTKESLKKLERECRVAPVQ